MKFFINNKIITINNDIGWLYTPEKTIKVNESFYVREMKYNEIFSKLIKYKDFRTNISKIEYKVNSRYFDNEYSYVWLSLLDSRYYIFDINFLDRMKKSKHEVIFTLYK